MGRPVLIRPTLSKRPAFKNGPPSTKLWYRGQLHLSYSFKVQKAFKITISSARKKIGQKLGPNNTLFWKGLSTGRF